MSNEFNKKEEADIFQDEYDVLLDHEYDGIRELDNHMPRWWLLGFYFTIVVGVFYLIHYHVIGWGPSSAEEYQQEVQVAEAAIAARIRAESRSGAPKKNFNEAIPVDIVALTDEASISAGKVVYGGICFACHGQNGEGLVGPNLTDEYWMYECDTNKIMEYIRKGFPDKGMPPYGGGKPLDNTELLQVTSYILSLQGTNPANAKAADMSRETICK